jgi:hypothetical protein
MRWAEHIVRIEEMRNLYNILVGKKKGRDYLGDTGLSGRAVLICIVKRF